MPSFGVNNAHPYSLDDTYRRYLPISLHFGRRGSYDLNHGNILKTCKPTFLFMISFLLICCIFLSWSFTFEYLLYNKSTIYNTYYLYYFNYSCIISARLSFLFLWTRIFPVLPNSKSIIQKCKKFSIVVSILILSISIGIYLTYLWYDTLSQHINGNDLTWMNNNSNSHKSFCTHIIECRLTDPLSFYSLFIQFTLLFVIIITYFVQQQQFGIFRQKTHTQSYHQRNKSVSKRKKSQKKRRKSKKKAAIALLETHDDDGDIDVNDEYKSDEEHSNELPLNNNIKTEPYLMLYDEEEFDGKNQVQSPASFKQLKCKILKLQIITFIIFLILWTLRYIFGILHIKFIGKYYFVLYALFVIIICFCKGILKRCARQLDGLRNGNVIISFEYLCEFYCCAVYWITFRQFIVYHVVFDDDYIYKFIVILCIHLLMEIFSFLIRISDWYFDNSNDLLHEFQQRQDGFYFWIYNKYNDDSNIYQWRTRLSFDLCVRINICLVTAIIQQIYLLLMIPSIYSVIYTDFINIFENGFNDNMFIKATIYNICAICAEIILYLITMIFVYKWYWMNIWQSFENMVKQTMGQKILLFYWIIIIVSIY